MFTTRNAVAAVLILLDAFSPRHLSGQEPGFARPIEVALLVHDCRVTSVAFSPDGDFVLTGCRGMIARLWHVSTGKEVRALAGHEGQITSVAFSPDGRFVLTGSADGTARLWDAQQGTERQRFSHDGQTVSGVAFSPDGGTVLTSSWDGTARLWDAQSGVERRRLAGHADAVSAVAFSRDGRFVLTGGWDHAAQLWDAATGAVVRRFEGHRLPIDSMAFSPDGRFVVTSGADSTQLWDTQNGRSLRRFETYMGSAPPAAFSPDGQFLAIAGSPARLVNAARSEELLAFTGHPGVVKSIAFSSDGRLVVTGGDDNTARVWNVERRNSTARVETDAGPAQLTPLPAQETATAAPSAPELIVGLGHSDDLTAVAFSPDGRYVLTGSRDKTARLWTAASGAELRQFTHDDRVSSVAFSPDGRFVLTGSWDNSARLWYARNGAELRRFVHKSTVSSVAFSPDGTTVLTGCWDDIARLWNVETGAEVRRFAGHQQVAAVPGFSAAFSRDGRFVVTGGEDRTARLWDAQSGEELRRFDHPGEVLGVDISRGGESVLTIAEDGAVRLWNAQDGRELRRIRLDRLDVTSAAISPDGQTIVTGGRERIARLWNASTGAEVRRLAGHGDTVHAVAFSSDGRFVVTGSSDETARVWDTQQGNEVRRLEAAAIRRVHPIVFWPDGRSLVTGGWEGGLQIWDAASGTAQRRFVGHEGVISSVAVSSDGRSVVTGAVDGTARLWDAQSGREVRRFDMVDDGDVVSVAFSPDAQAVLTCGHHGIARLWDVKTGALRRRLQTGGSGRSASFSPDGKVVLTADLDGGARLWDAQSGRQLRQFKAEGVTSAAFSADGRRVLAGTVHFIAHLWNAENGVELRRFEGHTDGVEAVAFSPDGRRVLTGGNDGTARLWDATTGAEISRFSGHTHWVNAVTFSPDGRFIVTGGADAQARFFDVASGAQLASLVSFRESDWLVASPDGLFDGSPNGWKKVLWRFSSGETTSLPVEAFFADFYRPGLLAELLAGTRPKAPAELAARDRRAPALAMTASDVDPSSRVATVRIAVRQAPADATHVRPSGARDVRLFRNGLLVHVWRGDLGDDPLPLETPVRLVSGDNTFTAYAFNADNVKSEDITTSVSHPAIARRPGTIFAIAVGANRYANDALTLRYAVADASRMLDEVTAQQSRASGRRVTTVPLMDGDATRENLLGALDRLAGRASTAPAVAPVIAALPRAQPEDIVLIFFAGHGAAVGDRFHLLLPAFNLAPPFTQLSSAGDPAITRMSVSDLDLETALEHLDVGGLLMIVDACNSGQALESEERRRGPMNSRGLAQLAYEKGMYVATAAQSYQAALEAAELGHGLLTYALVEEGLVRFRADASPPDGRVTVREWLDYAARRVPELQLEKMDFTRGLTFAAGAAGRDSRRVQTPRIFYRREAEPEPIVLATKE